MDQFINLQLEFVIRLLAAMVCGAVIGLERQSMAKLAGIRTHIMVAIAAAIMVIISKYGFNDVLSVENGLTVDVSRVAAGIITGIGFLGGGLILTGKQGFVSGITTAAGVWATVGVGMAMGTGMYVLGFVGTVCIIATQFLLHGNIKLAKERLRGQIIVECEDSSEAVEHVLEDVKQNYIEVNRIKLEHKEKKRCVLHLMVTMSHVHAYDEAVLVLDAIEGIVSYEI